MEHSDNRIGGQTDPVHVQPELGLYALGALSPADDRAVEIHLATCSDCRAIADDFGEVTLLLSHLSADDLRDHQALSDETSARPSIRPSIRATVPAPRARSLKRFAVAAVLTVVTFGSGAGAALWWQASQPAKLDALTVASNLNNGGGATAAVELPDEAGQQLRVAVVGLRPQAEFQILVITRDGQAHTQFRGRAAGGPQVVASTLTMPPDQVKLVLVAQLDGAVVVAVAVGSNPPS